MLKNLRTLILRSSILPRSGKVNTPMRVMTPMEMKLIRFTNSFDSSEVWIVFAWIRDSCNRPREFNEVNPLSYR